MDKDIAFLCIVVAASIITALAAVDMGRLRGALEIINSCKEHGVYATEKVGMVCKVAEKRGTTL